MVDLAATLIMKYGSLAVAGVVCLESMGLPLPGEAILIAAAVYAGKTGHLNIYEVIAAASIGAIVGDNFGYWIGREIGFRLLVRYGCYVGLSEPRIKVGQYLFQRHGGKIVFFGRFVALLRVLAAVLAGVNRMSWLRFLYRQCRRRRCLGDGVWAWRLQSWGGYRASDQACDARARRRRSCRVDRLGAVSACARRSRGRSGARSSWAAHQANHQACTTVAGLIAPGLDSP